MIILLPILIIVLSIVFAIIQIDHKKPTMYETAVVLFLCLLINWFGSYINAYYNQKPVRIHICDIEETKNGEFQYVCFDNVLINLTSDFGRIYKNHFVVLKEYEVEFYGINIAEAQNSTRGKWNDKYEIIILEKQSVN